MIGRVSSPSVCVIDDEEEEFRTILDALARIGLAAVHFRGDDLDGLPPKGKPLVGLRLIFTDLNINNASHKMALGYTAQVFHRIVSGQHGPLFAVVWSKHAAETDDTDGKTNAQKFAEILFSDHPEYQGTVFLEEMPKPLGLAHNTDNVDLFVGKVTELLNRWKAFDLLLRWESTLQAAALKAADELLKLARAGAPTANSLSRADGLAENLEIILKSLVKAQAISGQPTSSPSTTLASVMASLVSDQLDHSPDCAELSLHDSWLRDYRELPKELAHQCEINGMLLIGAVQKGRQFTPGTVYKVLDVALFESNFGETTKALIADCFDRMKDDQTKSKYHQWKSKAEVVVVELSPECDVQQGHRKTVCLVAGVIVPATEGINGRRADAWIKLPPAMIDIECDESQAASIDSGVSALGRCISLVFCARYKAALRASAGEPSWLKPIFRLRELPAASLRNWVAGQASRVGFVSL